MFLCYFVEKNRIFLYRSVWTWRPLFLLFLPFIGENLQSEKVKTLREHLKEKHFFLYIWTEISWHFLHIAISDKNIFSWYLSFNNLISITFFLCKISSEFSDGLQQLREIGSCVCQMRSCSQRLKTMILHLSFPIVKIKYFIFIYPIHSLFKCTSNQKSWSELLSCPGSSLRLPSDPQQNTFGLFSPKGHSHMVDMLV